MNPDTDSRVFKGNIHRPCFKCGKDTNYVAFGLGVYFCSVKCLKILIDQITEQRGLKDWVDPKPGLEDT